MWTSQVFGGDIPGTGPVTGDVDVEPAVVVIVPEPGGKTEGRFPDSGPIADLGKAQSAVGVRAVVVEEQIGFPQARDVNIGQTVVVVVTRDDGFDKADDGYSRAFGHLGKSAVPVIVVEFAGMDIPLGLGVADELMSGTAGDRFVADEQVDPAVVVEIRPGGRLGGMKREHTSRIGDVFKGAVAVVAQQGVGMLTFGSEPGPAQDEDIGKTIVVEVGMTAVQTAEKSGQPGGFGAICEGAVAIVVEVVCLVVQPP